MLTRVAVIFSIFVISTIAITIELGTVQSIAVTGILMCNDKPANNVKVKLYEEEAVLDVLLDERFTSENGTFEMSGSKSEVSTIDPKVNIYHKCNYDGFCVRKLSIEVPAEFVTNGEKPSRVFDIGQINLASKFSGQSTDYKTTVSQLQSFIGREVNLKPTEQILLTGKGNTLDPNKLLNTYKDLGSSGCPVFLFRKSGHDRDEPTQSEINYIFNQIKDCLDQGSYVIQHDDPSRIYLELSERVNDCKKLSTSTLHTCARLVQEHQFLYQGWTALIHNLDDSVAKINKRLEKFQKLSEKVGEMNSRASDLLQNFNGVLEQLKRIEIPLDIMTKNASCLNLAQAATVSAHPVKMTLFDWISKADPDSTLDEMLEGVEEQIAKVKDYDTKTVVAALNSVIDQSKNPEYRDIKGINKRFSQLEYSLVKCEEFNKAICELVARIVETPKSMDKTKLPIVVDEHKRVFREIIEVFERLRGAAAVFDQSKQELIKNVRTRLAGFIVQSYDKLNFAHLDIIKQEEQTKVLRFRLDLIEQIKESPIVFSQSVSEVIRRGLFKAELEAWHNEHSEKCVELTTEEKNMRKRIERKLEKHFLRTLFPGMFDDIPQFFVKSPLANYDERIPKIQKEYISSLRQSLPELEKHLKVKLPEISVKLMPKDARPHPPLGQTRRDESFITKEPMSMGVSHYAYSPAQWLSEDGGDSDSPPVTSAMLMARSPDAMMRESQMKPVPIVPSLAQLDIMNSAPCTSVARSAPIAIPSSSLGNHSNRTISPNSSPPMEQALDIDQFHDPQGDEQQFAVDDLKNSNDSTTSRIEALTPIKNEVAAVAKGLLDIRAEIINSSDKFEEEFKQVNEFLLSRIPVELKKVDEKHKMEIELLMGNISKLTEELANLREENEKSKESLNLFHQQKEEESTKESEKIEKLETRIVELESEVKSIETDTIKKLTVEYELMIDRTRSDYEDQISQKDMDILELKKELEKKQAEIDKQKQELLQSESFDDPYTEEYRKKVTSEIRSELEKEFKSRTEIIAKANEQKKNESLARAKKEQEVEFKILSQENESKAKKLVILANERDKLRMIILKSAVDGEQLLKELDDSLDEIVPRETLPNISLSRSPLMTQTSLPEMDESVMIMNSNMNQSQMMMSTAILPSPQSDQELDVVQIFAESDGKVSTSTQTKICLPSMNMMVTIQDIKQGSTVLVIWDERHKAYILFCSSQYRHFVKESSVRKLGLILPADSTAPRRNWILGKSMKIDNCAIKKPVNRYNLPVGTIVRRVEVDPVGMDLEPDIHNQMVETH
ncbi:unnamed protein product [Caenorhabditis angaria]|uniref:Autophagy-related protein 11 C-terminal domain-containing protein n=1 Tax=Caenorhabditis angaria TaxID=860376 RepID=A0A9P1NA89_9PELO|nr:unnamed protein product [Caenorhabditis angaria]